MVDALTEAEQATLREVAHRALRARILDDEHWVPDVADYPDALRRDGCSFITLRKNGELRGCIGRLVPKDALVRDVAHNAVSAALRDPRFAPVTMHELDQLELELSVLGPSEKLPFEDEADLLAKLRPGVDGLILSAGNHRGTFLPSVWDEIADPARFLRHLKRKAGLSTGPLPQDAVIRRYEVQKF